MRVLESVVMSFTFAALAFGAPLIQLGHELRQSLRRIPDEAVELAAAMRVDGDDESAKLLDPQLHETIMRHEIVPGHADDLLDRLRQERRAATEEGEVDAADLAHGLRAFGVEPALAADGTQIELADQG